MNKPRNSSRLIKQVILATAISGLGVYANAQEFALTGGVDLSSGTPDPATVSSSGLAQQITGVSTDNYGIPTFDVTLTPTDVDDGTYQYRFGITFDDDNSTSRIEVFLPRLDITVAGGAITAAELAGASSIQVLARNGSLNLSATADVPTVGDSPVVWVSNNVIRFDMDKLLTLITNTEPLVEDILTDGSGILRPRHYTYTLAAQQTTGTAISIGLNGGTFAAFPRIQSSCADAPSSQSSSVFVLNSGSLAGQFPLAYAVQGQYSVTGAAGSAGAAPTAFTENCGTGSGNTDEEEQVEEDTEVVDQEADDVSDSINDGEITAEDETAITNLTANAVTLSSSAANLAAAGNLSTATALSTITTLNKTVTVASTAGQANSTAGTDNAVVTLSNVATIATAISNSSTPLTAAQAQAATTAIEGALKSAIGVVGGSTGLNGSTANATSVAQSTATLLNALVKLLPQGGTLSEETLTTLKSISKTTTATAVKNSLATNGQEVTTTAELSQSAQNDAAVRKLIIDNSILLTKPADTRVAGSIAASSAAASAASAAAAAAQSFQETTNSNPCTPVPFPLGQHPFATICISNELNDNTGLNFYGLSSSLDATLNQETGVLTISLGDETYIGSINEQRVMPDFMPEGLSTLPDGRAVLVSDGVGTVLTSMPVNAIGFIVAVVNEGYELTFRENGAFDIDLSAEQNFSGVFAYDNVGTVTAECNAVSVAEPTMAVNAPGYAFTISCDNGIEQHVVPYISQSSFYDLGTVFNLDITTDRNTGIINIEGIGNLKPSFFSSPLTVADQALLNASATEGFAFRASDVNGDGKIDYEVIHSSGVQVLYGL